MCKINLRGSDDLSKTFYHADDTNVLKKEKYINFNKVNKQFEPVLRDSVILYYYLIFSKNNIFKKPHCNLFEHVHSFRVIDLTQWRQR